MELQGRSTLQNANFAVTLHNVPREKLKGICQWLQAVEHNTGLAVSLREDCQETCVIFGCMMFGNGRVDPDGTIHKFFTPHPPAY